MPMKLPKSFPRRKSSGNVLEDAGPPSEPSFRILERPDVNTFDGTTTLRRMSLMSLARPLSEGHLDVADVHNPRARNPNINPTYRYSANPTTLRGPVDLGNRGSGGTNNSRSSAGHEHSSSSARFSSSSTLPSSTDAPLEDPALAYERERKASSVTPEPSAITSRKTASKVFSLGRKKIEAPVVTTRPHLASAQSDGPMPPARERAFTDNSFASGSTAKPPKYLDDGLDFGATDNFGSMFEGLDGQGGNIRHAQSILGAAEMESPRSLSPVRSYPNAVASAAHASRTPPRPFASDYPQHAGASPRSFVSHGSQDGLMSTHSPTAERTFSYEEGHELKIPDSDSARPRTSPTQINASPLSQQRLSRVPLDGLRRSSLYASKRNSARDSALMHDEDARLVLDSIAVSRHLDRSPSGFPDSDDEDNPHAALVPQSGRSPSPYATINSPQYNEAQVPRYSPTPRYGEGSQSGYTDLQDSMTSSAPAPKAKTVQYQDDEGLFDAIPQSRRVTVEKKPVVPSAGPGKNKVMTPAQFELYKKQQEMDRAIERQNRGDKSDDDADEEDEDEAEAERNRNLAKQRRKQEAHLSVYRQQMMKVTGEQSSSQPTIRLRPSFDRIDSSNSRLSTQRSFGNLNVNQNSADFKGSDDEDEDVPLGVLAAHGFPNKSRPPTIMNGGASRISYKSESYPPPPISVSGATQSGRASGLPPFARNLPQDPYYGAGLVNSATRESLAFGNAGPGSVAGGASTLNPGGLVGVIADEERARAARRGSPNSQGNFGHPGPMDMPQMSGMPPGMPASMTPSEHATMQMSEQMNQMMHMQMQWMQQMQQMMAQGMQMPPGMIPPMMQQQMMMPQMASQPMPPAHLSRPQSSGNLRVPSAGLASTGRSMSMGMAPWPPAQAPLGNTSATQSSKTNNNINKRISMVPSMMSGALSHGPRPGYTPSIAPSERSNVGLPGRYRPVSIAAADEYQTRAQSRSSTISGAMLQPPRSGRDSRSSASADGRGHESPGTINTRAQGSKGSGDDDEDDDAGWQRMKLSREKKRSMWRLNRNKDEEPLPALEYYDYAEAS